MMNKKCKNCGGELPKGSRWDTKTCSAACRKAYSRRGEQLDLAIGRLNEDLAFILRRCVDEDESIRDKAIRAVAKTIADLDTLKT